MLTATTGIIGWLACVVYSTIPLFWLLIHPRADYWRSRHRSPYRVLLPYWAGLWLVVGAFTWHWRELAIYSTFWTWIPAAALLLLGFTIYRYSSKNFTPAQLGGLPELQPRHREQHLVTSGIRSRVRHPVYLGHLCEMLAWSIGTGLFVCYALTAFAIASGAIMIRMEDKELEERFGEEYRAYRKSVPAVVPARNVYNPNKAES
jgi:protein-S-isoprenylcysteine O-methyltransferase Ste14